MNNQTSVNDLKIAYKIISQIMKENHFEKDNSFNRVRNFISNKLCDNLIEE